MILKKLNLGIVIWLIGNINSMAQIAIIEGYVKDASTKEPISAATIYYGDIGSITDSQGYYQLTMSQGTFKVHCTYLGYTTMTKTINLDASKAKQRIDWEISEDSHLLETTVITGSRYEQKLSESTISIDVIGQTAIQKLHTSGPEKVLEQVPGVQIIDGQANIRGGSGYSYGAGSRVQMLVDDLPILQSDAAFPNWSDIPIENLSQIEVVKGAASALYGSTAMNGIIHFRTAYATSEPYTSIILQPKKYDKPRSGTVWYDNDPYEMLMSMVHRRKINKVDLVFGGMTNKSVGTNKGNDGQNIRLNTNIRYRFHERGAISVGVNLNKGRSSDFFYWKEAGSYEGPDGELSTTKKVRFNIDPNISYQQKNGMKHKLFGRYLRIINDVNANQSNESHNYYIEYQNQYAFSAKTQVSTGLLYAKSNTDAALYADTLFTTYNLAPYIQLEHKLHKQLLLTGGFRYEYFKTIGPQLVEGVIIPDGEIADEKPVFRFGLNYNPRKYTFIRASWGQGFRFPSIAERFVRTNAAGIKVGPNPGLKPESGNSTEIGVKQGYGYGSWKGFFDVAMFWSRYQDMMEFNLLFKNFNAEFVSQNVGNTDIKGIEGAILGSGSLSKIGIQYGLGYTYIIPKFQDFDTLGNAISINDPNITIGQLNARNSTSLENVLKYRSKHVFRSSLDLEYKQFSIGGSYNATSNVEAIDKLFLLLIPGLQTYNKENPSGYSLLDLRASYQIDFVKLQIHVDNVLNQTYTVRPGYLEPPRSYGLKIQYQW